MPDEARKADRGAFFRSIHSTLNHILWGDRVWLPRFNGVSYPAGRDRRRTCTSSFDGRCSTRVARWIDEIGAWAAAAGLRAARRHPDLVLRRRAARTVAPALAVRGADVQPSDPPPRAGDDAAHAGRHRPGRHRPALGAVGARRAAAGGAGRPVRPRLTRQDLTFPRVAALLGFAWAWWIMNLIRAVTLSHRRRPRAAGGSARFTRKRSMLYPAGKQNSLLASDWQVCRLLPGDSLEQLTDQNPQGLGLPGPRPRGWSEFARPSELLLNNLPGKGPPLQQALQGHRRSTNYFPNVTGRPLVTSHAFPSTRLIR